ncbi:MAG: 30S ribosome-binding factor RbfA [Planctomycetaceae bacterium]
MQQIGTVSRALHVGATEDQDRSTVHGMGNRRTAKVAEAIREVVSSTILFELRDPRIQHVTVLGVDVPNDLRFAKVRVSVMGDETQQRLSLRGLNASCGFLQRKVGDRVNLRWTPVLSFELDDGVKKSIEVSQILRQLAVDQETCDLEHDSGQQPAGNPGAAGGAACASDPGRGDAADDVRDPSAVRPCSDESG